MNEIMLAENSGLCFGVKRAIRLAKGEVNINADKIVYTLGPIIHNPQTVEMLKTKNILPCNDISELKERSSMILRSHGVPKYVLKELEDKNIKIIDATCPFVRKAQKIVSGLAKDRKATLIIGDRFHPEVIGIMSYALEDAIVINSREELEDLKLPEELSIICQTTQTPEKLEDIIRYLKKRDINISVYNTICDATIKRQKEAYDISKKVDCVIVIGGKNSSNTRRLFEICKEVQSDTIYIETEKDIDETVVLDNKKIGIVTGASTPDWIIRKVVNKLRRLFSNG